MIEKQVEEVRAKQDTPFDEIYHKERKLVSDIIKAELALKAINEKLPNPAEYMKVDLSKEDIYAETFCESQYLRDRRAKERMEAYRQSLSESESYRHQYAEQQNLTVEEMIKSG